MALHEQHFGGGSGGGGDDDGPNVIKSASGAYQISGNQVVLLTRLPLDPDPEHPPGPNVITILAPGNTLTDGKVDIRGSQGVRVTSGPPYEIAPLTSPPVTDSSTNGIEIITSEAGTITIQRGVFPDSLIQRIVLTPDEKILIDAGLDGNITMMAGPSVVTLDVVKGITLQFGENSITIDAKGITMQGLPFVKIN